MHTILSLIEIDDDIIDFNIEHIEDNTEKTNFDFFLKGNKEKYFFEVKYSESSFASTAKDKSHENKYLEIYKEKLDKIADIDMETFFKGYQIWRNIIYANEGTVVFVFPQFRSDLERAVNKAISRMKKNKNKIKIIYIEDICKIMKKAESTQLKEHYKEFTKKYFFNNL